MTRARYRQLHRELRLVLPAICRELRGGRRSPTFDRLCVEQSEVAALLNQTPHDVWCTRVTCYRRRRDLGMPVDHCYHSYWRRRLDPGRLP